MNKNWLKILVAISAILIAGSAAYFSVTGLGVLFSGAAIAATTFYVSELPKYTALDSRWSEINTNYEPHIYGVADAGIAAAQGTSYALTHQGWVGVTTYLDNTGALRVKTETLVAMSGITTGNLPIYDQDPTVA